MKHGSLFSGIGGFDLAAECMGWENVFQVEKDIKCLSVLKNRFKNSKRYGSIEEFTGQEFIGSIDVLSGGFPCQSFSLAGLGKVDLTLWKEMFRVVGVIKPNFVLAENVYGIFARKKGLALETVCADLESEGYTIIGPFIIPACAEGAWHRRDRVWIIAYSASVRCQSHNAERERVYRSERSFGETRTSNHPETTSYSESKRVRELPIFQRRSHKTGSDFNWNVEEEWTPWSVEPLVDRGVYGVSSGVDRVAQLGNGIYPKVAFELFKAIEIIKGS